ncbi:ribonuclease J1 [Microcystis aeruginosa NIES-1211]|uniref:Ribonuclease J n=1 Tax=Microcystis aeruginosa NIES-2519 TaxID=2303981 RepID=A0A5A5RDP8_MICAE|nr:MULTISPECIES: ribonuclease J [Microcystis]AVQ71961.1 ribonuclease J [Microcystis sp. MC19]CCI34634.1 Ribonuclease J [Microcystis sp. T1-4]GBL15657.1 ribonuclease J1 [Microcystis aeruginosa NIES-1211]GCA71302.1 ribonuclease J1 [Microcystis aeruginosa NIES-2519]GCA82525.1 ribonuclease J1 [Microcystis aeruginosa NIES-2522]
MSQDKTQAKLKIIPLGGLHEIGKNTCVFEYDDEIILLDAGLAFPSDDMHGVNVVLPDMTYLRENRHKIKGMIVTHGHEDHIGGIPYHLKQFDVPIIYGPRLAMALLRDKLEEAGLANRTKLETVAPRQMVRLGKSFMVEYIRNTHSIADSFCVAIHTPLGVVIHTGDFKIDHTPVDGEFFDLQKIAEHGEKGVLCLLSDSTNAEVPGYTPSEASVYPGLERVFNQATGRIMITTFASSVHRINLVLKLAQKFNRKVVVVGRSMLNVIAHARNLGYIKCPDDLFEPLKATRNLADDKIVILTTGSQGEPLAAMTRISKGEHPHIRVRQGDTIVFSANPIPGNTIAVVNTIDRLMMQGANVVYGRDKGIHVSGHGSQEDHKLMLSLTRPKFFVPVHGEHRMLVKHAQMAQSMGIPAENMVIVKNGDTIELTGDRIGLGAPVPSGIELVDQAGVVHEHIMQERQQLAEDGVITIAAFVNGEGQLSAPPEINLRGVVTKVEISLLNQLIIRAIERCLSDRIGEFKTATGIQDWAGLRAEIETTLQRLIKRELQSQPLVIFLLQAAATEPANNRTYRRRRPAATMAS